MVSLPEGRDVMKVKQKKTAWLLIISMFFSIFTGSAPLQLLRAAIQPVTVTTHTTQFTYAHTTAEGLWISIAGDFNGWNDTDKNTAMTYNEEDNLWHKSLSVSDYPALGEARNEYKYVFHQPEGTVEWMQGNNLTVYRESLLLDMETISVARGETITLPGGKYYRDDQSTATLEGKDIIYTCQEKIGIELVEGQLKVDETCLEEQVMLQAKYDTQEAMLEVNILDAKIESPIIHADRRVTFNVVSDKEMLYYIGSDTSWQQQPMDKKGNVFTYTTVPLEPGMYEYKFKPHQDDWEGSFTDPCNELKQGDNSVFYIEGLQTNTLEVKSGAVLQLPQTLTYYSKEGEKSQVHVAYRLRDPVDQVTLQDNKLEVTKEYRGKALVLEVIGENQSTTQLKVNILSRAYTYTLHYLRQEKDYTDWNLWIWETGPGKQVDFTSGTQEKTVVYHSPDAVIHFIVRKGEWQEKDVAEDRNIEIPEGNEAVEVWLVQGDKKVYYERPELNAKVNTAFADSQTEILFNTNKAIQAIEQFALRDSAGNKIPTTARQISATQGKLMITDGTRLKVNGLYTLGSEKYQATSVTMRGILDDEAYYYQGKDLGYTYSQTATKFKLWAPTATQVILQLEDKQYDMLPGDKGVWEIAIPQDLDNKVYGYTLKFANGQVNEKVVDPYARALTANSRESVVVDLAQTNPESFKSTQGPAINSMTDVIAYELHVRDFSIDSESVFKFPGKYKAFTEEGLKTEQGRSVGIDYLKELGITHIQLQPVYDFGSVNEEAVSSKPSDTNYNWGYDPQNYNVPEGAYATDLVNPKNRIIEFKEMIQALHQKGIGVIMDVVYNHTYNPSTQCFEQVVPGYYYRTDDEGNFTNGSGCGNEIASERPMVRKYIQDSTQYWVEEYGIDGFRFDLMGLIDIETMKQVTQTLKNEVSPDLIIYGEPWTGGTSGLSPVLQTTKGKQKGCDFGIFNDTIRTAIKGDSDGTGKGFATGEQGKEKEIIEGIKGSINTLAKHPTEMVNYVTAHDNLNLWDKVLTTMGLSVENPYETLIEEDILDNETVKRCLLANGIVLTSQGLSFLHGGEEILRSKKGEHNSYKSSDFINRIDWSNRDEYAAVFEYYAGLIRLRKDHPAFRMTREEEIREHLKVYLQEGNVVSYELQNYANGDSWQHIVVIYNGNKACQKVKLPREADWKVVVNDKKAGVQTLAMMNQTEEVEVQPLSMMVLYDEGKGYEAIPTTIEVENRQLGLEVGSSQFIKAVVVDQHQGTLPHESLHYISANPEIARVTDSGKVIARAPGKTSIMITCGDINTEVTIEVVAQLVPTKIAIKADKNQIYKGYSLQLVAQVYDQFNQEILSPQLKWQSSHNDYATVDYLGRVTAIAEGEVKITAYSGNQKATITLQVKEYEERCIVFEYYRPDGDYEDWNLWTWATGIKDGQVDFKEKRDGWLTTYIPIGPEVTSVGFIVRKGTDWDTAKQDIVADRYITVGIDQVVTKVRVIALEPEITILSDVTAPIMDATHDCIHFSYREDSLFKKGKMNTLLGVQIVVNNKVYDMIYDKQNERYTYDLQGLQAGTYYYHYLVTDQQGKVRSDLDKHNPVIKNNESVIIYKKMALKIEADVSPHSFDFREAAILTLNIESATQEDISNEVSQIIADLSMLGMSKEVTIDPYLKQITLTTDSETIPGIKEIPICIKDRYGNTYKTVVEVEVEQLFDLERDDFDWDEAVIYQILTDRFYNGESKNDDPKGNHYSKADPGAYHGGDLIGITKQLDYLKQLGVNTLWISPLVEQIDQNVLWDNDQYKETTQTYYAYHGYWAKNFEKMNPHMGTLEDLHQLIDEAHARNMKIMVDVVLNHTGYGTNIVQPDSKGIKNYPTDEDRQRFKGMLRQDGSMDMVQGEISKGLPDFITEDPKVREKLINWQIEWVKHLAVTPQGNTIDYFRIDTAKHVDKATLQAFKTALTRVKSDFKTISEAWLNGKALDDFLNKGYTDGVLNFDFNDHIYAFVREGKIDETESYLEVLNTKTDAKATYGNFLASHDEDGFLYTLGREHADKLMLAASLQATAKGQPIIYYGEEIGQSGANNWPYYDNRYDYDWTLATGENKLLKHYQKVFSIREKYSNVFARGTRKQLGGGDKEGYLVFAREHKGEAVVTVLNTQLVSQKVTLTLPYQPGKQIRDWYSGHCYTIGTKGEITCIVPPATAGGTMIFAEIAEKETEDKKDEDETEHHGSHTANSMQQKEKENQGETITFKDIREDFWAKPYIDELSRQRIMIGKTVDCFKPEENVKRGELCAVIARAFDIKKERSKMTFKDIRENHWAKEYIEALANQGIVKGYSDGTFKPDQAVSREEMASIIERLYYYLGKTPVQIVQGRTDFIDDKEIANWAIDAVKSVHQLEIMSGTPYHKFLPKQSATRAEVAKIIVTLLKVVNQKKD